MRLVLVDRFYGPKATDLGSDKPFVSANEVVVKLGGARKDTVLFAEPKPGTTSSPPGENDSCHTYFAGPLTVVDVDVEVSGRANFAIVELAYDPT